MGLLKIFGLGKRKQRDVEYDEQADGLALAREQMLGRMRARMEAEPLEPAAPLPVPYMTPETQPVDAGPAATETPPAADADPLAGMQAQIGGEATAGDGVPGADDGLMDLFRGMKEEVEEGSLASEVDDVSIGDLLGDVLGVSTRLGVKPAQRQATAEAVQPEVVDVAPEPEPEADPEPPIEEPAPIVVPPNLRQVRIEELDDAPAEPVEPEISAAGGHDDEYQDPPFGQARVAAGERYILHVLFLGLSLVLGAGLGIRSAEGGSLVTNAEATPAVLAYLNPPIVPPEPLAIEGDGEEMKALQKEARTTATPSPTPTPSPSPSPAPQLRSYPFIPGQPAWMLYEIQSGDSLSSVAEAFGMCPDHILWNNPGREEEDRMIVGDDLLLPGYPGIVYRIQEGETLAEVAARYSTSVDMVLAYTSNGLTSVDEAEEGTVVLLPDAIPPSALLQDADAQWAYTNPSIDGYVWPFYGPITTYYGEVRPGYVHNAIDIGGLGHFGAPVIAAAAGRIDKVESLYNGLGRYVVISHEDGSRTVYGHMSDVYVKVGDRVRQGEPVGALGCTGHSTGTHLHFELWIGGAPVDPLYYLP